MNSTESSSLQDSNIKEIQMIEENLSEEVEFTDETNFSDSLASVTENISRARLTLEEIIANDNDASRQQYLPSPTFDDASSVSSVFESDAGSLLSTSSSFRDNSSIKSASKTGSYSDPFKGMPDDEFSNLDRYGFLNIPKSRSINSIKKIDDTEFIERERRKL